MIACAKCQSPIDLESRFTLRRRETHSNSCMHMSRQLARWTISDAERSEVTPLQTLILEIRPLIQRLIALKTELDRRRKPAARPTHEVATLTTREGLQSVVEHRECRPAIARL
jgi:hypothetical protein